MNNHQKKLLIATGNKGKAGEIITILNAGLNDLGVEIVTYADLGFTQEVEEVGSTYSENAAIKSDFGAEHTGLLALGDDVGLEIDYLNGQPGLYSRRFAGEQTPFSEKMRIILDKMEGVPDEKRTARFQAAVAISAPSHPTRLFTAKREGGIAQAPSGKGGFGYDPIFFLPDMGCTMADLAPEVKNQTSHRAKVLAAALPYLRELFAIADRRDRGSLGS